MRSLKGIVLFLACAILSTLPSRAPAEESNPMLDSLRECAGPVGTTTPPKFPHNPAVNCPDEVAWDLFIKLNHPVTAGQRGVPDSTKKLGDPGETVWESWKLRAEIFGENGCRPSDWETTPAPADAAPRLAEPASKAVRVLQELLPRDQAALLFDPKRPTAETRLNKAAFDFIVSNELFNVEGQLAFAEIGRTIDFPPEAREIKSAWKVLSSHDNRDRYHSVDFDGKVFGLIALHIITKDLPQWFWSTFEHVDNPDIDVRVGERFVDRHTMGGENLPAAIKGTKWENYRLKGTQTSFVDLMEEPTILANAIIEQGFQGSSSCVSCHARAAINRAGEKPPVFEKVVVRFLDPTSNPPSKFYAFFTGSTGAPDAKLLENFTQLDFMWSMASARPKGQCP